MRFYFKLIGIVLFTVFPAGAWANTGQIKVVATFSILGDVVKNVGGDKINLTVMVGPDGDAHTFEPTPKESILLAKADVIFENGLFFEHWMDDFYAASGSRAKRVVVTQGIETISLATQKPADVNANPDDVDPHVWQDANNVMVIVQRVRDGLVSVDPDNKAEYEQNARQYLEELNDLNRWISETLKNIPAEKRKLVTSHDSLGYFAKGYGFQFIGAAIPSATTEAEDPSAAETARLLDVIKSSGVKALFSENIHNAKLIKAISVDTGVVMAPALYTDALGAAGSEGETYIKMMRHNVKIFAEYLK